jgi:iron-sulfur cluster repair protein YtfE (RIC family)
MAARPDAIQLLKADHRKVEQLFSDYEDTTAPAEKKKIAQRICLELTVHTRIEEEIFYPAIRRKIEEGVVDEGSVEHDGAKVLIAEIEGGSPKDQFYDAKVKVLSEQIKHHVKEEERLLTGMFSQARRSGADMKAIGALLQERKTELVASYRKKLTKPETTTFKVVEI